MNKKLKRLAATVGAGVLALAASAQTVFAQEQEDVPREYPFQNDSLAGIAGQVIRYIMMLGAIIALIFLVIGGVSYITSGGDKMKVQDAQGKITSAIVGLVIVLGAFLIIKAVCFATGLGEDSVFCNV
jgi:uncharacterized membrane protein